MATTLTLRNVPDEVYDRLRWSAEQHRRSEAITCLESVLMPERIEPSERIARARTLRGQTAGRFEPAEIDRLKRQGRA